MNERRNEVFSIERGNGSHYINLTKLYNKQGTGYCQQLVPKNLETYKIENGKRQQLKALLEKKTAKSPRKR